MVATYEHSCDDDVSDIHEQSRQLIYVDGLPPMADEW